jgi:Flp pilus assembly protein TadD
MVAGGESVSGNGWDMENSRIEFLEKGLLERPNDLFLRYALAMELLNSGRLEEAWKHFAMLLEKNADYSATYYQAGMLLARMGRREEARRVSSRGVDVTRQQGNAHAAGELEAALHDLTSEE